MFPRLFKPFAILFIRNSKGIPANYVLVRLISAKHILGNTELKCPCRFNFTLFPTVEKQATTFLELTFLF